MKDQIQVQIITSPTASTNIEMDLVKLTEYLSKKLDLYTGYGLGGEFGYGVDFENNIFMMHPFCWCEQEDCEYCFMNDNTKKGKAMRKQLLDKYGDNKWSEWGYAPMFFYKPTKLQIRWYKWIGRDTEFNRKVNNDEWKKIYEKCIKSIEK